MPPVITPEHIQTLFQGISPFQVILLGCLGALTFCSVMLAVRWIVDMKTNALDKTLQTLIDDNKEIKAFIQSTNTEMALVKMKLWTPEDLAREVGHAIRNHEASCPYFKTSQKDHN